MNAATLHIFISTDPADRSVANDLQKNLLTIDPSMRLRFWDPAKPLDTEYRKWAKTFLDSVSLFIIVHSPDYENLPNTRWEMETALAEKARRPESIHIVVVQARYAVIPVYLHGFLQLPEAEEAIEGASAGKQLLRTSKALSELLRRFNHRPPSTGRIGRNIPLTLPDLQERLEELTRRHNLTDVLALLHTLVFDEQLSREIRQMEDDFVGLDLKANIQLLDYQVDKQKLKRRISDLIESLTDERLLIANWRVVFLERYHQISPHRVTAFFFPNDEIQIPETLNLPVTPNGTEEHVGFLSYEQKLEFRRLLLLCQDALAVEKYQAAHTHCEQVRTRIDPQSAQLYEYLLLSFIKKEGADQVVRRLIDGIPSGFNHVKLYSDRFNQYQNAYPAQCPSETGVYNQEVAVEEMAAALHGLYSAIAHNAVCDTGRRDTDTGEKRQVVLKCMEAFFKLYHSLAPAKVFLDTLIIELLGGAKFSWLSRVEAKETGVSFICNSSFDLKGKVDELLLMLENADPQRIPAKQREMIREDLFWGLLDQCEQLALQVREERRLLFTQTDLRRSVIRVVQAGMAGHYLLTRAGDVLEAEKSLLRLSIELLIPNLLQEGGRYDLPEEVLIDWFTLDAKGQLLLVETGFDYRDFNALSVLQRMISDHAGADNWPMVAENIRKEIWIRYVRDTAAIHEKVRDGLQWSDFRRMDDLEARKLMVSWLHRMKICYLAYPETGQSFLDQIILELTGSGLMSWLVINPGKIGNHADSTALGYDARMQLHEAVLLSETWTEETTTAALVGNLFHKQLVPEMAKVKSGPETERAKAATLLACMVTAFNTHPLPLYLDAVHKELVEESKFKWVEIDKYGKWLNYSTEFDAIAVLEQLTTQLPLRYPLQDVKQRLADNRWKDQLKRYEAELSMLRHENRLPERRIAVDIIWRLKGVFLFWPDRKYLELPLQELNDRGRIRWFERFLGIVKISQNHHENLIIGFDLKAERVELQRYWDEAFQYAAGQYDTGTRM